MTSQIGAQRRDYEEVLRSLGHVFDEEQFQDLALMERASGFLVTALRPALPDLLTEDPESRFQFVEVDYPDSEIVLASMRGVQRRGSRHRADRNELALRLIGRYVNENLGSRILVVDQGDRFWVRMMMEAQADMPHHFNTISSRDLEEMREVAVNSRRVASGSS